MAERRPWTTGGRGDPRAEEGFLSRWARRKREHEAADRRSPEGPAPPTPEAAESAPLPAANQAEVGESVEPGPQLPSLDSIDGDSDVSAFLSDKVSEEVRRLALRKLFHSARFNVRCPLDDYAGDYTTFQPLGDIVTADMRHRAAVAAEREARAALADEEAGTRAPAAAAEASKSEPPGNELASRDGDASGAAEGDTSVASTSGAPQAGPAGEKDGTRTGGGGPHADAAVPAREGDPKERGDDA